MRRGRGSARGGWFERNTCPSRAPQAGRETRRRIKEFVENSEEKAKTSIREIKGKVNSALEKGEDILQEKKSVLTTAVEAGKEAYQKEKKKLVKESPGEDH